MSPTDERESDRESVDTLPARRPANYTGASPDAEAYGTRDAHFELADRFAGPPEAFSCHGPTCSMGQV
ncbi:hypothetical protein SprV_0200852100 [Sparganum proliferum]